MRPVTDWHGLLLAGGLDPGALAAAMRRAWPGWPAACAACRPALSPDALARGAWDTLPAAFDTTLVETVQRQWWPKHGAAPGPWPARLLLRADTRLDTLAGATTPGEPALPALRLRADAVLEQAGSQLVTEPASAPGGSLALRCGDERAWQAQWRLRLLWSGATAAPTATRWTTVAQARCTVHLALHSVPGLRP